MADPLFTRCSKVTEGQIVHMHSPDCECYSAAIAAAKDLGELRQIYYEVTEAKVMDVAASVIEEAFIG